MKRNIIVSLNFSYVSHSGGVIDFANNLVEALLKLSPGLVEVVQPCPHPKNAKIRTGLRFLSELWVALRYWQRNVTVLYPNYFFVPLPFSRSRSVVVVHDLMFKHYPQYVGGAKRIILDISYRLVRRWADGVVFISKDSQDDFLRRYGAPRRYTYIYNPVVLGGTQNSTLTTSPDYAIANFHYYPHKNVEGLLKTFSLLKRQWPTLRLVFTGNRPANFDDLMATYPDRDSVTHRGFLPKAEVFDLIQRSAFFISMSQFEGFNMSAAEAALFGRPLILSEIPVHKELFNDCSTFLNESSSETAVAAAVRFVQHYNGNASDVRIKVEPTNVAAKYLEFLETI